MKLTHKLLPHSDQCLWFVKVIHVKNTGNRENYKKESGNLLTSLPRFTKKRKCKFFFPNRYFVFLIENYCFPNRNFVFLSFLKIK